MTRPKCEASPPQWIYNLSTSAGEESHCIFHADDKACKFFQRHTDWKFFMWWTKRHTFFDFVYQMCCAEPMLSLQNSYSIYILKLNLRWLLSLQTCIEVVEAAEISKIWQSTAGTFADLHTKHCFNSWGNLNQRQSLYKYPFTILDNINCK